MVKILVQADADHQVRDSCRCPCSPSGCSPLSVIQHQAMLCAPDSYLGRPYYHLLPLQILDWMLLVWEYRGIKAARTCLLEELRARKHLQLGMTHVCCWSSWNGERFDGERFLAKEERLEILEEESDFVTILNE